MRVSHPHGASFPRDARPEGAFTVWAPFLHDTTDFADPGRPSMFNLVVDYLDEALAQVQEGGARLAGEIEEYDYGRFG